MRRTYRQLLTLALLLLLLSNGQIASASAELAPEPSGSTSKPPVTTQQDANPTAEDLALAMGVPAEDLVSADLMGSDPEGTAVAYHSRSDYFHKEF